MYLATTGLSSLLEKRDEDRILLAGEWCLLGNERILESRDYEVLEYPWDDRDRLYEAYLYTDEIYRITLPVLASSLNVFHGKTYSNKFWEIVVGPWLKYFIQTVYDRYCVLLTAVNNYTKLETDIFLKPDIPNDHLEFQIRYISEDRYNLFLFSQIIKLMEHSIETTEITVGTPDEPSSGFRFVTSRQLLRTNVVEMIKYMVRSHKMRWLADSVKLTLFNTHIGQANENKLIDTYQGRRLAEEKLPDPPRKFFINRQDNLVLPGAKNDEFIRILSHLVLKNIPFTYLESYPKIEIKVKEKYPSSTKLILTSNNLFTDDFFKVWTGIMKENGAKLVIHQHGGLYGAVKFYPMEDHEVSITDVFLSWGWSKSKSDNTVKPFYVSKNPAKENFDYDPHGKLLIGTVSSPKYTKYFYAQPLSCQINRDLQNHFELIEGLRPEIREQIVYRRKSNLGWNESERIQTRFPTIGVENLDSRVLVNSFKRSRLVIATFHGTLFLESFMMNLPTMILWDPKYRELRNEAIPYYEGLVDLGILYYSPKALANQINMIYHYPMDWWNNNKVQEAKDDFCNHYARRSHDIVDSYSHLIDDMLK